MPAGLAAFLYVAALWWAAPAVAPKAVAFADRARSSLLVGIAVPLLLGAVHLLYAPVVWLVLAALVALTIRRRTLPPESDAALYATLAATLVVIWPPLVRPLLDGDSLAYHLPNAASWVQTHSIWATSAPYWYYPPASEMFAAGLLAAAGRWSLPLAGVLPALLLTARVYTVARRAGAPRYAAAGVPLAFLCTPLAAFQSGTLQNDLWLAAFFVEILAAGNGAFASVAICALLKPFGWIEAAIATLAGRKAPAALLGGITALLLWAARDAVLFVRGPLTPLAPQPAYWPTTIAGNFAIAFPQLLHGIAAVTPQCFIWTATLIAGLFFAPTRRFAIAGAAALLLYVFLPVSYSNGVTNYVLDASSLRYALPAFACGALIAGVAAGRVPLPVAAAAYALAAWGAYHVLGVFWNDAYTRYAPEIALVAVVAALFAPRTRAIPAVAVTLALLIAGTQGASSRANGFYADWMRDGAGHSTGAFAWLAQNHPERVVARNVRSGAVLMSSPHTFTLETANGDGCTLARSQSALLFVGSNEDASGPALVQAFDKARSCGTVLYADGAAVIVRPRS